MNVIIQSPTGIDKKLSEIESMTMQLSSGEYVSILTNHAPMVALLASGTLKYKKMQNEFSIPISESILYVKNNLVKIMTIANYSQDIGNDQ